MRDTCLPNQPLHLRGRRDNQTLETDGLAGWSEKLLLLLSKAVARDSTAVRGRRAGLPLQNNAAIEVPARLAPYTRPTRNLF